MIWSIEDLRALAAVEVSSDEVVYAFVSLAGRPSQSDEALLDDHEAGRARRFVNSLDERRFVLAHAALRLFLGRCLDVAPVTVAYESGPNGKPRLADDLRPLEFNMSHSGELCLVAACPNRPLGIDVEQVRWVTDALAIADMHFSDEERAHIRSARPAEREAAFLRLWTLTEAVLKTRGEGLGSLDVDSATAPSRSAATSAVDGLLVRELASPPGYVSAAAIEAPPSAEIAWRELPASA